MTHADALAALLTTHGETDAAADGEQRRTAEAHVASCRDCWEMVALLSEAETGSAPVEDERMRGLLRCDDVRQRFHLVAVLDAEELAREHADIAAHVGWCESCRERLLAFLSVDHGTALGEFDIESPHDAPAWKRVEGAAGRVRHGIEATFELIEQIGVRIGRTVDDIRWRIPPIIPVSPIPRPAMRGAHAGGGSSLRLRLDLLETPIEVDLTLRPTEDARADILVGASGREPVAVRLRTSAAGEPLVASQTAAPGGAAVFLDVPADDYLLELEVESRVFRVPLAITSGS